MPQQTSADLSESASMPNARCLFLSYSSHDREKARAVHRFLAEHGVNTFFDEQNLRAGQNWPNALEQALRNSYAMVVFVGAQIGNWQWPEIGFGLDRQANDGEFLVIPVLLDGADISRSFLFLNTWIDLRGVRFTDPEAFGQLLQAVLHPANNYSAKAEVLDFNPFRGLEAFNEEYAPFFFGREKFVDDLLLRLTQQKRRFVAVIGPSGCGKSSVLRAGLIPKLRRRRPPHETWDIAVFTPGERPWFRLADALGPLRFPDKSDADLDIAVDKLAWALQSNDLSLVSLLDRILQRQGKLHRLLLVVDQFEELFTLCPPQDRTDFIVRLMSSMSVEGTVLIPTLRADFYGQAIEADRGLSDLLGQDQVTLGRLTAEELGRAVVEPARLAGLVFDPGLPELLLRDAGNEPGNLPLLQYALLELYSKRRGNVLTNAAYQAAGGIRQAIALSAERQFQILDERGQGAVVRRLFTQLVRLAQADEGTEDTRRRVATAALPAEVKAIIDEYAGYNLRLLVKGSERISVASEASRNAPGEHETVEVAHEALIREWDRLRGWLNEDRGFYLWRQRLDHALGEYKASGEHADFLLQGPTLKEAEGKLAAPMPEPLAAHLEAYIQRSITERDRRIRELLAEKEEFQRRERDALAFAAQEERRGKEAAEFARHAAERSQRAEQGKRQIAERAKRISWGAAVIFLFAFAFAGLQYWEAVQELKRSTFQRLLAESFADEITGSPYNAEDIVRVLFAHDIYSGLESFEALQQVFERRKNTWLATDLSNPIGEETGGLSSIAFNPKRDLLAWSTTSGDLFEYNTKLYQLQEKEAPKELAPSGAFIRDSLKIQYSPNGTELLSIGFFKNSYCFCLWDVGGLKPKRVVPFAIGGAELSGMEFGEKDIGIALDYGSPIEAIDVTDGRFVRKSLVADDSKRKTVVAFSHDLRRIVARDESDSVEFWDFISGETPIKLLSRPERTDGSFSMAKVAIASNGELIAYMDKDKLELYNAATKITRPIEQTSDGVWTLAFSPSGKQLAVGDWKGTVRIFDTSTLGLIADLPRAHPTLISALAFSSDERRVASGDGNGALRIWQRFDKDTTPTRMPGHINREGLGGTYLSSGGGVFWTPSVWDEGIRGLAVSPDGSKLATAGGDGRIFVRDVKSGQLEFPYEGHTGSVTSVAWLADGKRFVSVSKDGSARIWEHERGNRDPHTRSIELGSGPLFKVAVTNSDEIVTVSQGGEIRWIDPYSFRVTRKCELPLKGERYVEAFGLASNGTSAAISSASDFLLVDPRSCRVLAELSDHELKGVARRPIVDGLSFVPNQDLLVAVGKRESPDRGWVGVYSAVDGKMISREVVTAVDNFSAVTVSAAGQYVATASGDGIHLLDIIASKWVGTPFGTPGDNVRIQQLAFLPNSKAVLAAQTDGAVEKWPVLEGWYDILCENLYRKPNDADWKAIVRSIAPPKQITSRPQ